MGWQQFRASKYPRLFSPSCLAILCAGSGPRCFSLFCDGDKCQATHAQGREHLQCLGNQVPWDQPAGGEGAVLFPSQDSFWWGWGAKIHPLRSTWGIIPPSITIWEQRHSSAWLQKSDTPGEVNNYSSCNTIHYYNYNLFVCVYFNESD